MTFYLGDVVHRNISQVVSTWEVSRKLFADPSLDLTMTCWTFCYEWPIKMEGKSHNLKKCFNPQTLSMDLYCEEADEARTWKNLPLYW